MKLDHFTIRTTELDNTRDFFCEVLELEIGERPPFKFPGYWLYHGGKPVVHLISLDGDAPSENTGAIDHIAFGGDGERYDEILAKLDKGPWEYRSQTVPGAGLRQLFVTGPHNVVIELNFPPAT